MINNLEELPIFLACLWCGLVLGAVYEMLALVRRLNKTAITLLADILFGLIQFTICALALIYCDNGHLRLYSVCGFLSGFILFRAFPSKAVRKFADRVSSLIKKHKNNKENEVQNE